jgi:large subunit ribosomal protein L7/L12
MADLQKLVEGTGPLTVLEAAELVKMLGRKMGRFCRRSGCCSCGSCRTCRQPLLLNRLKKRPNSMWCSRMPVRKKIETIKVIRQLTNLGLVEAKNMAETAGAKVLTAVSKEAAADAKAKLEAAGAVVEVV